MHLTWPQSDILCHTWLNATVNAIVNANGNVNRSIRLFSQSNKLKCAAVLYLTGNFSSAHTEKEWARESEVKHRARATTSASRKWAPPHTHIHTHRWNVEKLANVISACQCNIQHQSGQKGSSALFMFMQILTDLLGRQCSLPWGRHQVIFLALTSSHRHGAYA